MCGETHKHRKLQSEIIFESMKGANISTYSSKNSEEGLQKNVAALYE